jgi:hypothetical protein
MVTQIHRWKEKAEPGLNQQKLGIGKCEKMSPFLGHCRDKSVKTVLLRAQCVTGGTETETTAL